MYKVYLQAKRDAQINDSFYYDQKLQLGISVLHNNVLHEVVHCREISDCYTTEQIKEQFVSLLNKTYHNCTESEMEYIIESLDKETFHIAEELNKSESENRSCYDSNEDK